MKIILLTLSGVYFLFVLFLMIGIFRLKKTSNNNKLKASVIIPFRNERKNIRKCIESVLNQTLEKERYEIILVDDHSDDNYLEEIQDLLNLPDISLIKNEESYGKKSAIAKGISNSKNEIIITTDADCVYQKNWLSSLLNSFDNKTGFVAGKVVYYGCKNIFEELQKIEFVNLVSIGASMITNGIPLLANGASCAYRKDLFFRVGGFSDNLNLVSGDEEFLMQKIHFETEYEVKFCSLDESTVFSEPVNGLKKFINQRKRWVSKVPFYRNKILLPILVMLYLFYLVFVVSIPISIVNPDFSDILIKIFITKNFLDFIYMFCAYRLLGINNKTDLMKLILLFPIAEFLHLFYISFVPILSFVNGFTWKGRVYKK